jgi:hypothetical protein
MLHCLLFLLALSFPASYTSGQTIKTATPDQPKLSWLFDIKENEEGTPHGKVYL